MRLLSLAAVDKVNASYGTEGVNGDLYTLGYTWNVQMRDWCVDVWVTLTVVRRDMSPLSKGGTAYERLLSALRPSYRVPAVVFHLHGCILDVYMSGALICIQLACNHVHPANSQVSDPRARQLASRVFSALEVQLPLWRKSAGPPQSGGLCHTANQCGLIR
jgi:hypothetical protein